MSDDDLRRPREVPREGSATSDSDDGNGDQPVSDETMPLHGAGPSPIPPPTNPYDDQDAYRPPPNPYSTPREYPEPRGPYGQSSYGQIPYGQTPSGQTPYGQTPYGQTPYASGPAAYAGGDLAEHPSATTAMVLGIVSLAGLLFTVGLTLLLAPAAWVVGARAVREIDASPGRYAGRDRAQAGKVMGIIGTVLLVLGVLAVIAFVLLVFAFVSSDSSPVLPSPQVHSGVAG